MNYNYNNAHEQQFQQQQQQLWAQQFPGVDTDSFEKQQQHPHIMSEAGSHTTINPHQALDDCIIKNEDCDVIDNQLFNSENLKNFQFQFNGGLNEQIPDNFPHFETHSASNSSDISQSPINLTTEATRSLPDASKLTYPSPQHSQANQQSNDESLSEEELMKRRKAQNRAAQRAFRERKEMKLKELEDKLDQSEKNRSELLNQLDELRKRNIVVQAENKILLQNTNGNLPMELDTKEHNGEFSFPTKDSFYSNHSAFIRDNRLSKFQHNINHYTHDGYTEITLGINGVWEFVNEYNEKNDEDVDANLVLFRLKGKEVCKVNGPAYDLCVVIDTLKEVAEDQSSH
ncbi:hypothetical protein WICPIJ_007763 [Wickerhamomyces pijperi]|uniref:BZIP domain-containing protein n=1 Tax=Wickerhamomyces pijperi TaxID=599730 RepID=A0A9P8PZX3_WICPI|nr:hypothetical protein WICPIJ_007763 [Wickerhamomyces pijperi]